MTAEERRAKRTERMRDWRARNPERANAIAAACRQRNRAKIAASQKIYRQNNKAKLYEYKKAYLARNREKLRKWKRADYERHREAYIRRAARDGRTEAAKLQRVIYYRTNKERIAARHRQYVQRNQKKIAEYRRLYRLSANGRASKKASDRRCATRVVAYKAEWGRRNRERLNRRLCMYVRFRSRRDPAFAIRLRLRARLVHVIRRHMTPGPRSVRRVIDDSLGCSMSELMSHLESKFLPGMSWNNRNQWHVDHIKPLYAFDLTDPEQQAVAFHYSNLQPLWALDNMRKGGRWKPHC